MDTIDQRLSRVERRTRTRGALLAAVACVVTACLVGGAGQPESVPAIVRAQRFELVTATGQKVAEIAFNSDIDCGEITISSSDGTNRVRLAGGKAQGNGFVEIYGREGAALGGLYADDNTGSGAMALRNAEGRMIHYMGGDSKGNGCSSVSNRLGKPVYRQACSGKDAGWLTVCGSEGNALVRIGGANEDGHGALMLERADGKRALLLKAFEDFSALRLYDSLGRVRTQVVASTEHGARVAAVTPDGQNWNFWPETPESKARPTNLSGDPINSILNGGGK